jgi:putative membrane protein insertion efficiency factor
MSINEQMIKLIKKYQSNKPAGTPARCVHYPTCSNYGIECYKKFNFFKATFLTSKRILLCTPLNRKFYDPVPLTKQEKKIEKELNQEAIKIKEILLEHYNKYPKMVLQDFIKLIYQNSFGPRHLSAPDIETIEKYLVTEMEIVSGDEYIENIGNGYVRVYLGTNTDIEKIKKEFYNETKIETMSEENIRLFYRKINILAELIKKDIILLPKKESLNEIREYLSNGITAVRHSSIYNNEYHPHYRVLKKH